ncbi:hypothetical protein Ddc_09409 [Ditylenchus destructor]|nr:hypothetical protein Ddc_09409 [Ditylenchus destructor]
MDDATAEADLPRHKPKEYVKSAAVLGIIEQKGTHATEWELAGFPFPSLKNANMHGVRWWLRDRLGHVGLRRKADTAEKTFGSCGTTTPVGMVRDPARPLVRTPLETSGPRSHLRQISRQTLKGNTLKSGGD